MNIIFQKRPESIRDHFERHGFFELAIFPSHGILDDKGQPIRVNLIFWDMDLYLFLHGLDLNGVQFKYIENMATTDPFTHPGEVLPREMIRDFYVDYIRGYHVGYSNEHFNKQLEAELHPLEKNDSNIKKAILRLRNNYSQWRLRFYPLGFEFNDYFQIGAANGFFTKLDETIKKHGLENDIRQLNVARIDITERMKINELTTFFRHLYDQKKIDTTLANLERFILTNFTKQGNELSPNTINTNLKTSKKFETESRKINSID